MVKIVSHGQSRRVQEGCGGSGWVLLIWVGRGRFGKAVCKGLGWSEGVQVSLVLLDPCWPKYILLKSLSIDSNILYAISVVSFYI